MKKLIRSEKLANCLSVDFWDNSNRYYGDYHRVHIEVRCMVPVDSSVFSAAKDPQRELDEARQLLGESVFFIRTIEKMGVEGAKVEQTRDELIENFIESTFSYLETESFSQQFVAAELANKRKSNRPLFS